MVKQSVKKGRHDFKPNNHKPFTWKSKISVKFSLTESMWFSREDPDYPHGNDVKDWNKLAGLTWFFSGNTKHSLMLAWRPVEEEKGAFEITGYINPAEGKFEAETIMYVVAGTEYEGEVVWVSDQAVFKLRGVGATQYHFVSLPLPRPAPKWKSWLRFYRQIGPWFGGNRPAHKDMTLHLTMK